MAIFIKSKSSNNLIDAIYHSILKGDIESWTIDNDGDFTSTSFNWKNKAWLKPYIDEKGMLIFGIILTRDISVARRALNPL